MVVADASFCGAWFLPDERSNDADRLLESLVAGRDEMWVPALWFYELANLFRSARRPGFPESARGIPLPLSFVNTRGKSSPTIFIKARRVYRFMLV